ncbi:proline-rich protein 15 [Callorhinchus milii]|uniref:Proline rich 15 n=1 Tax=Callorhinchus milii TaxID=7868 RepID=K4G095_CALMI|nr:proline-rich protein 15 [Callorhinchus milii]AFK10876.1 proline-rich protein 15-like protein [Callorhinchus milii]|eukprot:gi/632964979/ref/XP_007898664.1/ PREDICTED: proline-rich protein 15 [Callorhinchus milii]
MADGGGKTNWWKSFTVKKKPKELAEIGAGAEHVQSATDKTGAQENKPPNLIEDKEYPDSKLFNEKSTRRNLNISRSGRFKEKRRVRAALPDSPKFFEDNTHGKSHEEK